MKHRRSAHSRIKKFYYLTLILLGALSIGPGCHKSKQANPCEDVLNEGTPTRVGLVFVDGTGENILLSKNIDAAAITITPEPGDLPSEPGVIIKEPNSPWYGSLMLYISDTKKGTFKYKISIPNAGSTTLSYINKEEKSDNPCKPYYISVTDPVIEDHPFTVSRVNSRLVFRITM